MKLGHSCSSAKFTLRIKAAGTGMAPYISYGIYDMTFMILILTFPPNIHGTRLDAEAHTADMVEKLQNMFGSSAGNVNENNFTDYLESSSLKEYAAKFSENGYDDLNLLKLYIKAKSRR